MTPLYAAFLALFYVFLSVRVIKLRRKFKIAIGSGQNAVMERAIRAHANFAEYVPFALLMITFVELSAAHKWIIHTLGAVLCVARIAHAYGVSKTSERYGFRTVGMVGTLGVLVASALYIAISRLFYI